MPPVRLDAGYGQKPNGSLRMSDYRSEQLALIEPLLESNCCGSKKKIPARLNIWRYTRVCLWLHGHLQNKLIQCIGKVQNLGFQGCSMQPPFFFQLLYFIVNLKSIMFCTSGKHRCECVIGTCVLSAFTPFRGGSVNSELETDRLHHPPTLKNEP